MVFQVAAIGGPVVAGFLLGHHLTVPFVAVLLVGCALMIVVLGQLERVIPAAANGMASATGADDGTDEEGALGVPAQRERSSSTESVSC
jgi:MFS family permease